MKCPNFRINKGSLEKICPNQDCPIPGSMSRISSAFNTNQIHSINSFLSSHSSHPVCRTNDSKLCQMKPATSATGQNPVASSGSSLYPEGIGRSIRRGPRVTVRSDGNELHVRCRGPCFAGPQCHICNFSCVLEGGLSYKKRVSRFSLGHWKQTQQPRKALVLAHGFGGFRAESGSVRGSWEYSAFCPFF